ncbi:Fic family protein [Candidatus Gottesmanbacteria bacterium]|nr:Fic family protein [Candidatus Gottesmanbacteria bacterium]
MIPPKYVLTTKISQLLSSIEASRAVIDAYPLPPEIEANIRRTSSLKSSLYSARIEGNPLTLEEMENPSRTQKKQEVFNILKALNWLRQEEKKDMTLTSILKLHMLTMKGLTEECGRIRTQVNAIFNSAGIAIYIPPPPRQVTLLLERLVKFATSTKESLVPIRAVLAHYTFEKIHPFLDGNGRVGRLVMQKVLAHGGYSMKGLLSMEEFLDTHRSTYYKILESPERDATDYVEFMLEAIDTTARHAKEQVIQKQRAERADYLLPRRAEIYYVIKDHRIVSFDQIHRRFMAVNPRTLRYDLKKLQEGRFIRKRGTTKGVYYESEIK